MLVSSLTQMEQIVDGHPDLSWEGWDVVLQRPNSNAQYDVKGVFHNGQWYKRYTYPITTDGWYIPERFVR